MPGYPELSQTSEAVLWPQTLTLLLTYKPVSLLAAVLFARFASDHSQLCCRAGERSEGTVPGLERSEGLK